MSATNIGPTRLVKGSAKSYKGDTWEDRVIWTLRAMSPDRLQNGINALRVEEAEMEHDTYRLIATDNRRIHTTTIPRCNETYALFGDVGTEGKSFRAIAKKTSAEIGGEHPGPFPNWQRAVPSETSLHRVMEILDKSQYHENGAASLFLYELGRRAADEDMSHARPVNIEYLLDAMPMKSVYGPPRLYRSERPSGPVVIRYGTFKAVMMPLDYRVAVQFAR